MIDRSARLATTGLLAVGLAVAAAAWPSSPPAPPPPRSAALSGTDLFRAKGCATCHNGPETSAAFAVAPDLGDLARVAGNRVDGLDAEAYVRQSVRQPQAYLVTGFDQMMPTLPVDDAELDALVRYLLG